MLRLSSLKNSRRVIVASDVTHVYGTCDMIEVKGGKSIQILSSQSRNGVLTIAAFTSGHLSDGRYSVGSRRRAIPRQDAGCAIAFFVLFCDRFRRMRSIVHRHVHQLDRRDHAFVQPHQSLQRAAIRSVNVSICASIRSRCQLIVGPPKLRPKWRKEITSFMATRSQAAPLRRPLT